MVLYKELSTSDSTQITLRSATKNIERVRWQLGRAASSEGPPHRFDPELRKKAQLYRPLGLSHVMLSAAFLT